MADNKATKAGARHSSSDIKLGRSVKAKAREIVRDMDELGFPDEQEIGNPGDVPAAKGDDLPAVDDAPIIFGAVKAAGEWELDVLYMPYGGPKNGKDAQGEYFSARTEEHADKFPHPVILYYHGFDPSGKPQGAPEVIGKALTRWADSAGRWVRIKLDSMSQYARRIWDSAQKGLARASSGSIAHLVRRDADGHLTNWPVVEISLIDTDGKRQPANSYAVALPATKSLYQRAGIEFPADITDDGATPQATGTPVGDPAEQGAKSQSQSSGELDMDEQKVSEIVAAALKAENARREAEQKAEAERQSKEQERIDAAVKAAEAKAAKEMEAMKAEYVKAGRLPLGEAPYQARFAEVSKYDDLDANDMAFLAATLTSKQGNVKGRLSESAAKALAIKIAEDKSEAVDINGREINLGEAGRMGLKALGIDPADVVSAKANEVNYSTLASYGDEWVGVEYSRRLWPAVRANTFVLQKLPQVEVPQGTESIKIPLESADPTFYKVAQTTDENATTKTPNATVPSSKLGTANQTLTVDKGGGRVQYSGEMEEDSLIPWASQLRAQLEKAAAENFEHVVIDGDTETGATTNINTIGGTPGGAEFYLLANGFRKLALVTNTANSASIGALADTSFLTVKNLMGAAGKNAADKQRVDFILDPNVYDKALQLASVKTADVFPNATVVEGELTKIWGYNVFRSYFMHWLSTTNPYKANTSGKVNLTNQALNTTGAFLMVRWDQWLFGWKRRILMETVRIPRADVTEITATMRFGLVYRDIEASAIGYNVTL